MVRLRARYQRGLSEKLERLRGLGARLDDRDSVSELLALVHKLAGSGASFGWPRISDAAADVERVADVDADRSSGAALAQALDRLIAVVDATIAETSG